MSATARERADFLFVMGREGVPAAVARTVLRYVATYQRLAELDCSSEAAHRDRVPCPDRGGGTVPCLCADYGAKPEGEAHGTVPRFAVRQRRIETVLTGLLAPYQVTPVFSGDPRGATVKLRVPSGKTDDWGETGVCVPS